MTSDRFAVLRKLVKDYEFAIAQQDVQDIVISWKETHEALNYAVIVELLDAVDQRDKLRIALQAIIALGDSKASEIAKMALV